MLLDGVKAMTTWICRKCNSKVGSYRNEKGKRFSCSNDECDNYSRIIGGEEPDFLRYFKEE